MSTLMQYSEQFRSPYWAIILCMLLILYISWTVTRWIAPVIEKRGRFTDKGIHPGGEKSLAKWVVLAAILLWIVLFSVGMNRHLSFHSKAWDLAIFDQVIWNLANGNGWECSVRDVLDLRGDHFEPILLAFVPFYKIYPSVAWLLGIQALALVGAGLILWGTYRSRIGELPSMLLFLALCFYPPLHWLALADFHPIALGPLFIALGWLGSRRNNALLMLAGMIGLGLCGEEGLIVAGWWGLWEFLSRRPWRKLIKDEARGDRLTGWIGLASLAIFFGAFLYLSFVWIPAHRIEGEGYFYVHRYEYLGGSMGEIIRNIFTKPGMWIGHAFDGRGIALLALYLVPLALLPLQRFGTFMIMLPTIMYTLLSVSDEQRSIYHQYTAMWIILLFIVVAETLVVYYSTATWTMEARTNPRRVQIKRALSLIIASFLGMLIFSPIIGWAMHPELLTPEEWAGEAAGVVMSIGPDEAISAPSALCPHLSHRRVLLLKPDTDWEGVEEIRVLPDFPP